MKSVLEELWYGSLLPHDDSYKPSRETKEAIDISNKNYERLAGRLDAREKELFERYVESINERHSHLERELFIYAFSLGGRFMLETIYGCNSPAYPQG
jgi:hypothetical protein